MASRKRKKGMVEGCQSLAISEFNPPSKAQRGGKKLPTTEILKLLTVVYLFLKALWREGLRPSG